MKELSIFVDESGGQGGHSKYYVLTLVFHDQDDDLTSQVEKYKIGLSRRGLMDIPFHAGPLLTGHDEYEHLDLRTRKSYLSLFFLLLQHLPIRYYSFVYRRSEMGPGNAFVDRMRRDLTLFLFDNLSYFQSFDKVKVYYDDGQEIVAHALHAAVDYVLTRDSLLYRRTRPTDYVLSQAADLICTLELTACKYVNKEATNTDNKFFGTSRDFRNNYMKAIKRKRVGKMSGAGV